jgi:hypothetical protein
MDSQNTIFIKIKSNNYSIPNILNIIGKCLAIIKKRSNYNLTMHFYEELFLNW